MVMRVVRMMVVRVGMFDPMVIMGVRMTVCMRMGLRMIRSIAFKKRIF
jgi:hypothetical protein